MKILVIQSGGPSPVSNAALSRFTKIAAENGDEVWGAIKGWLGAAQGSFLRIPMDERWLSKLNRLPPPYLNTFRDKLADEEINALIDNVKTRFDALAVIGGDGSMTFLNEIQQKLGIPIVGIPKTIDNDLGPTFVDPGFPSAAHEAAKLSAITRLDLMSYTGFIDVDVIQVMGRDAGWVTLSTSLAGKLAPDLYLIPEGKYAVEEFVADVTRIVKRDRKALLAVAEGVSIQGNRITRAADYQRADSASSISSLLKARGLRTRMEWPGILYRSIPPIKKDLFYVNSIAEQAVKVLRRSKTAMVGLEKDGELSPREFQLSEAIKRYVPKEYFQGLAPTPEFLRYIKEVSSPVRLGQWVYPISQS